MIGTVLKARYIVEELVGTGGMSEVYRALDLNTERQVAIKVLREEFARDEEFVRRFHREAQAAAALSHEYLVGVHDLGEQDGIHFIVLEYVKGTTLKEVIRRNGALPVPVLLRIGVQMCAALEHAHNENIVHRDIKPQNILVDNNGRAKLTDFGIARATTSSTVTITDGSIMGSVHYFSPEQARGELAMEQSDLYSLGVVLYEMATAHLPFEGDTAVSVALQHLQEPPKDPKRINPDLPTALCEVILKAMSKDPSMRYQTAAEMEADLLRVEGEPEGGYVTYPQRHEDGPTRLVPIVQEDDLSPVETDEEIIGQEEDLPLAVEPTPKGVTKLSLLALSLLVVSFGALAWVVLSLTNIFTAADRTLVPAVVNLTEQNAIELLADHNLRAVVERENNPVVKAGVVVRQSPTEDTQVNTADGVQIWVSKGPAEIFVPSLFGMDEQTARERLTGMGLTVGEIIRQESDQPRGRIFHQEPLEGTLLPNGEEVILYISEPPLTRTTPNLFSKSETEARKMIVDAGLSMGKVYEEEASDVEAGIVFRQSPESGKSALDGSSVDIWVSITPQPTYRKTEQVELIVPEGGAQIKIYMDTPDGNRILCYDAFNEAGTRSIELSLESPVVGKAKLSIQANGKQVDSKSTTFSEKHLQK